MTVAYARVMRRLPLVLVSVLLCGTALACGGDEEPKAAPSPSTTTASPTPSALDKATFVSQVNTICKRVSTESDAIGDPETAKEFHEGTQKYVAVLEKAQADLTAIEPPAADKAAWETNFLDVNEKQISVLKGTLPQLEQAAAKNDATASQSILEKAFKEFEAQFTKSQEWSTQYGLTDCAE